MRCNCLDLMGDSPNFRGKNCEQSMGKLEFKRKKNKSKERKSNKHFIYYLIVLSKKAHCLYCISELIILKISISFASHSR